VGNNNILLRAVEMGLKMLQGATLMRLEYANKMANK